MLTETTLTEKSFNTGELTINYAERPASGAPIVLLHGGTQRWQDWDTIIAQLDPSWHIYACDLRGHGKSGRSGDNYLLTDFASDISAFLREVVVEPAVVVGHSLGAMTAIGTAAVAPDYVRALVPLDPPLFIREQSMSLMPYVKYWLDFVHQMTSSVQSFDQLIEMIRPHAKDADETELHRRAEIIYGNEPRMLDVLRHDKLLDGYDLTAALERITCPTLILCGEWDKGGAMRDEDIAYAKAHIRNVEVVQIAGADHQLTDVHSAAVLEHLASFVQTVGI